MIDLGAIWSTARRHIGTTLMVAAVLVLVATPAWASTQVPSGNYTGAKIAGAGPDTFPFIVDGVILEWWDGEWYIWDGTRYVGPNGGTVTFNGSGGYQHQPAGGGTPSAGAYGHS